MDKRQRYKHTTRIRFTHTDPAGFVFFPRYFEKFQSAIEDWFNFELEVDYAGLVLNQGLGLPTVRTECTFVKPCLLGEMLDLEVELMKIGTTSLTVEFIGTVAGEERLRARSVLVLIALGDGRPVPFPAELREKLENYRER